MKHDPATIERLAERIGLRLSVAQAAALVGYETLLLERAIPGGMIGAADAEHIRERHVLDSLRAVVHVDAADRCAYDLGSGAGLPGIPVAIACPQLMVTLVEARRRRAGFLELAAETLRLQNVRIAVLRIETLADPVDLCLARALAPLPRAWRLAEPLLLPRGRLLYFAGTSTPVEEVTGARVVGVHESPLLERAGPLVIMAR